LSKTAEYALRAAVCLAADPQRLESAERLAKQTKVPRRYLHRVLQDLVRAGLAESNPGPRGGYRLSREPAAISILDVVVAVAPIQRIEQCPLGLPSHVELCPLHAELDAVLAHVEQALKKVTLAQVLQTTHLPHPLCDRPTCAALGARARSAVGQDG
jgi:Rrf2 family protein